MNIVEILREAIGRLPLGDHSTGLNAIFRHVESAIRHFERDQAEEPDRYTDVIYRANQAYEGSLKEAYRVLADKDPSGQSTHEIERYLETNTAVRPRVLTQFTRYRQDYRNPSTHDYKLDFDENEALLAIVSVCAFAKLLVDQISSKLVFNAAVAAKAGQNEPPGELNSIDEFIDLVLKNIINSVSSVPEKNDISPTDYDGLLAGTLEAVGVATEMLFIEDTSEGNKWDILAKRSAFQIGIETRWSGTPRYSGLEKVLYFIKVASAGSPKVDGAVAVVREDQGLPYKIYELVFEETKPLFVISRMPEEFLREVALAKEVEIKTRKY